ncbi:ParB family protein [Zophobihabitans entericus]|uniref:Integrating conjugative element, PFGI_1 class, ParB family protein n=1 Tax=Zophobihabitans entericus TaxID=1635327 RepID=A0A6G9ID25_9GAMM|nr:ParB family protein [Zophobihabitans entericus]QIQ22123.1 hypothetical protein IPMB12_10780 [Zophobihabitans entericus]
MFKKILQSTKPNQDKIDPTEEVAMIVTLDQLRPYEHNPRITRNPLYDEIKASIRERNLDHAPNITQRPNEDFYIICDGGNTRLAILNELWSETKEKRYFEILCFFKPWQGELKALTGHLVEDAMHGQLTFIERALAVEKTRSFYEEEVGREITQKELSEHLSSSGYPVSQTHISRMQDAINYLLPVLPIALYGGLSKNQISKLLGLRKSAQTVWNVRITVMEVSENFADVFHDLLSLFDCEPEQFNLVGFQDELTHRLAELFQCSYDLIILEMNVKPGQLLQPLVLPPPINVIESESSQELSESIKQLKEPIVLPKETLAHQQQESVVNEADENEDDEETQETEANETTSTKTHLASAVQPVPSNKVKAIQQQLAALTGESFPDLVQSAVQSIPAQANSLYPITDIWLIEPNQDEPQRLRLLIGQFALEIADELEQSSLIEMCDNELGYIIVQEECDDITGQTLTMLLKALSGQACVCPDFYIRLSAFLIGLNQHTTGISRLSDTGLVKLFRIIRLARRLYDLTAA